MRFPWMWLKYVPANLMNLAKRFTSAERRLWIWEKLGGGASTFPDKIISVSDGRRFHIGPDYIYLALLMGRDFEPEATSVVRRLVGEGDTVLDIGANYGW